MQKRAHELGIKIITLDEIGQKPAIKLVKIASSDDTRIESAEKASRAGKAVMCEKIMGTTIIEAEHLVQVKWKLKAGCKSALNSTIPRCINRSRNGLIGENR